MQVEVNLKFNKKYQQNLIYQMIRSIRYQFNLKIYYAKWSIKIKIQEQVLKKPQWILYLICVNIIQNIQILWKQNKKNFKFQENRELLEQTKLKQDEDTKIQKELEQRQKKEEQEEQKLLQEEQKILQEKIKQEKNLFIQEGINSIKEEILDKVAGIILMVQLTDYLNDTIQQLCRFEILYILKQATILIQQLKDRLEQKAILGMHDHIKIKFDIEIWMDFYEDRTVYQLIVEIESKENQIKKKYIDYLNLFNNYTYQNFPNNQYQLEVIANLNLSKLIDIQLYQDQLFIKIQYLRQDSLKTQNEATKHQIQKCILCMQFTNIRNFVSGQLLNIQKFIQAIINEDLEEMKSSLFKK
ncbi:unnamed protein product [Paramecium pentaurelia]|uniref:Uncharacterized protein n=1 Tax=Paramecium pentaurelia TaxID=43138 RepID=A0A8S1X5X2_9CILI|nr:unnamed protein product [Paramecium pentaurelia]